MASVVDDAIQAAALSGLAQEVTAQSALRQKRADQLGADSASMWAGYLTTPNPMTGIGYRTLQQSAGYPASSGTGTGGTP
jgi:hypothetical protein